MQQFHPPLQSIRSRQIPFPDIPDAVLCPLRLVIKLLWIKMTIARKILGYNHQISYYTKTWRLTATTRIAGSYMYIQHNESYCCSICHATVAVFKCPVSSLLRNVIHTTELICYLLLIILLIRELVFEERLSVLVKLP